MAIIRKLLDSLTDANDGRWKTQLVDSINYLLTVEDFHEIGAVGEPAFEGSWINQGGINDTAAFYKDPFGRVFIKGAVKTGTINTTIFTLPEDYRPDSRQHFAGIEDSNASNRLVVNSDGTVITFGATASLSQTIWCSFRV